jgi:hypothetical protein
MVISQSMKSFRILAAAAALVLSAPALAQPALRHLSGELRLNSAIDVTNARPVPLLATLTTRTGETCQLTGTIAVHVKSTREPRWLEALPGEMFIHCPGKPPALVVGQLAPAHWTPPQTVQCKTGMRGTCNGYSAAVATGASAMWITWHALTSERAAQPKGARHD